jgi:hypothetical protein
MPQQLTVFGFAKSSDSQEQVLLDRLAAHTYQAEL